MRKTLLALTALLGLLFASATPATAITGNYVDDLEHPYVGLIAAFDDEGEFMHRCSGSLLTPTVFLTAGHCTEDVASANIYFQQDAGANYDPETQVDPITGYPETCAAGTLGTLCATSHELYNYGFDDFAGFPDTKDLGIVILDQPIELDEYGSLAEVGSLDDLATARGTKSLTITASGYGLSYSSPVAVESFRSRLMATGRINNLTSHNNGGFNVQTNGNGKDKGGTCSGDSGGPIFYGGFTSNTIIGVTSFGLNAYCRGADFAYRTDTQAAQDWILSVIGAEEFAQIDIVSL